MTKEVTYKTLRDEFAMAAMAADSLQSALIAVAYTLNGRTYIGEQMDTLEAAKEYYRTADAMLKAREVE